MRRVLVEGAGDRTAADHLIANVNFDLLRIDRNPAPADNC